MDANGLMELPLTLSTLGNLKVLSARQNKISSISLDRFLSNCDGKALSRSLLELDLSKNAMTFVPNTIIHLKSLNHVCLAYNQLQHMEKVEWGDMQMLTVLNVSSNKVHFEFEYVILNNIK